MEWVKDIVGMNYFWLISNCFCSSVFAFLFFCISLFLLSVLLLPCSLLYTFNFCYNMCPQLCSVSFFSWIFPLLLSWCCLSSSYIFCSRWCSLVASQFSFLVLPTIHLLRPFLSLSIYSPSFFSGCFLFWHGYSSIRTILRFSTPNSSNDFIELG